MHMNFIKLLIVVVLVVFFGGCKSDNSTDSDGWNSNRPVQTPEWVEGAITQPVPSWGSRTRLILPVALDRIGFDPASGIGAFGSHQGGHPEGLDHVWMEVTGTDPIRSWAAGTVTKIENMGGGEYFITIEYDGGLTGKHMEVRQSLVTVGQHVNAGDPICYGLSMAYFQSAEFMLIDRNRNDGETAGSSGSYVSPFDYLRDDIRAQVESVYVRKVMNLYFGQGKDVGNNKRIEPYLTNRMFFHPLNRNTLVGEWLLNRKWGIGNYPDILTFLRADNPYMSGGRVVAGEDATMGRLNFDGPWDADTLLHHVTFEYLGSPYFGLYSIDESGSRALLKLEYRTDVYPTSFTDSAVTYIERAPLPRRVDAEGLGVY